MGGRGRSGRKPVRLSLIVKTGSGIPAPGIPSHWSILHIKRVICVIHVNQHYGENGSRARFRAIQILRYFARMSPEYMFLTVIVLYV